MAFIFLSIFTFFIYFQPGAVYPELASYGIIKYSGVIALLSYIILGHKYPHSFLGHKYTKYFFLFILMQTLSASALWFTGGIEIFNVWRNIVIIFFLIVVSCVNEKKIISIQVMIVLAILYLSFDSVSNVLADYAPGVRAQGFGWYENGNDLVLILVTVIPLAFSIGEYSKSIIVKYIFIAIAGFFSFNILLTGSREGLLGLLVVGVLGLQSALKLSGFTRKFLISALVVSVITIGITTVLTRDDLQGNLIGDESSENRILQWKACYRMVKANPLLGIGPGEAGFLMRDFGGVRGLVPHNTLIQVFAETGIPGGIFFFLCTCYPLWEAWKFYKLHKSRMHIPSFNIYKYLSISLCGFWSCAFFSNRVYFAILYTLIALIVAVQVNIIIPQEASDDRKSD